MNNPSQNPTNNSNKSTLSVQSEQINEKQIDFVALLNDALTDETLINKAYSAFSDYSFLNQILAASQLRKRFGKLSPIATFKSWKEKGRFVKKGEKAIHLVSPIVYQTKSDTEEKSEGVERSVLGGFRLSAKWFCLEQTEGADFIEEIKIPTWDAQKAMASLNIEEVGFDSVVGNLMGYAQANKIAINPLNPFKHKTRFHEVAHIVLGHTAENKHDVKSVKEVEAEGVAFMLCSILNLDGIKQSRGYIQSWLETETIPQDSARKIFAAADKILKAGQ